MEGAVRRVVRSGRVKGGFYLRVVEELLVVRELFIPDFRTSLPARELSSVRLAGLVFGCCREDHGLGGCRGTVYRGTVCSEPDRHFLREGSQWRRANMG